MQVVGEQGRPVLEVGLQRAEGEHGADARPALGPAEEFHQRPVAPRALGRPARRLELLHAPLEPAEQLAHQPAPAGGLVGQRLQLAERLGPAVLDVEQGPHEGAHGALVPPEPFPRPAHVEVDRPLVEQHEYGIK